MSAQPVRDGSAVTTSCHPAAIVGVAASDLRHIPGETSEAREAQSLRHILDPLDYCRRQERLFGPISRGNLLAEACVNLMSAEACAVVLGDRSGAFSSYGGWHPAIGELFPRGLMLRDFDDHREQRRLMQPAFRRDALAGYVRRMAPRIAEARTQWLAQRELPIYPQLKQLTLTLAADVFLGLDNAEEIAAVNRDFVDLVEAATAINRVRLLGDRYLRALHARERLERFFRERVSLRRDGEGGDLFSRLCRARDEHGQPIERDVIVDHMIFLMMAAHDTTTSALTTMIYALARHPDWQQRLREEAQALGPVPDLDALDALTLTGQVLREALRLYPPLTTVLRRTTRDCTILGVPVPAHTAVNLFPVHVHRLPQWWGKTPDVFDPDHFSTAASAERHPYAWIPFGGGAHTCIGLHFAIFQIKAIVAPLLQSARISVADGYTMPFQFAPISRPRDGLPICLTPL